jgi:hypothetical protein
MKRSGRPGGARHSARAAQNPDLWRAVVGPHHLAAAEHLAPVRALNDTLLAVAGPVNVVLSPTVLFDC